MARIAIVGPGAMGGVAAAWLSRAGRHQVILCARRQLPELVVETPSGMITARLEVLTDPAVAPRVDWVLVATKSYDAAGAAAWFDGLCAGGAPVAILQNGVEHRERFSPYLPAERLLPVVGGWPAERDEPTRIRQRGPARIVVEESARGREFASLFEGTEIEVSLTRDFKSAAWHKLCGNSAGVLTALLLAPSGVIRDNQVADIAREIVRECIAVGRAEGAVLADAVADAVIDAIRAAPPDGISSLHADRIARRPMEIDARNGAIVRLGQKHGIATPFNRMAVVLLEAMSRLDRSQPANQASGGAR